MFGIKKYKLRNNDEYLKQFYFFFPIFHYFLFLPHYFLFYCSLNPTSFFLSAFFTRPTDFSPRFLTLATSDSAALVKSRTVLYPPLRRALAMRVGRSSSSTVSLYVHNETIKIRLSADTRGFHPIGNHPHWREERIDGDHPELIAFPSF